MRAMRVRDIVEAAGGELCGGDPERLVMRVSTDSRSLRPGDLFFALRGTSFDGHWFIDEASRRGAVGAVIEPDIIIFELPFLPPEFAIVRVPRTLAALQRLAVAYRRSLDVRVVGVTGSSGKTSTKEFVASVLARRFRAAKTAGNLNNHIGVPLTLLGLDPAHEVAAVEIATSRPGEIAPLARMIDPEVGVITGIGSAHAGPLGVPEDVAREKGALAEALPPGGVLVLGEDNAFADQLAARSQARTVRTGFESGEVQARDVVLGLDGTRFTLVADGIAMPAFVRVPGRHMVRNALLAVAVGRAFGVPLPECARGLAEAVPLSGRMTRRPVAGVEFFDDTYNANPESTVEALRTLGALPTACRRVAVLGEMAELGAGEEMGHRGVGTVAAECGLDCLVTVGPRAGWIAEGAAGAGLREVHRAADTDEAVQILVEILYQGDTVLVKGSRSARMERIFEGLGA